MGCAGAIRTRHKVIGRARGSFAAGLRTTAADTASNAAEPRPPAAIQPSGSSSTAGSGAEAAGISREPPLGCAGPAQATSSGSSY